MSLKRTEKLARDFLLHQLFYLIIFVRGVKIFSTVLFKNYPLFFISILVYFEHWKHIIFDLNVFFFLS
jgi:hypothetical protein